jgi:hypothetical protein
LPALNIYSLLPVIAQEGALGLGHGSVVECLPSKCSISSTAKEKSGLKSIEISQKVSKFPVSV